jgi:Gpi18-like mannosyltransferase
MSKINDPFHSFKYLIYDIAALITVLVVVCGIVEKELIHASPAVRVSIFVVLILFGLWVLVNKLTRNNS